MNKAAPFQLKEIIGRSRAAGEIRDFIERASCSDLFVLLCGETGVGKEVVARHIHYRSRRQEKPLVSVSCANIPENLAEAELFGYKRGAFTDAREDKRGLVEEADGSTLFLDEIGDCPLYLQSKLLRVLEDRKVRRLGETKVKRVDTRFIFATNKKLEKEIKAGKFRQDLYYRISSLRMRISPLRERQEDIPLFVRNILNEINEKTGWVKRLSDKAQEKLLAYDFPGNIRELENLIGRAHVYSEGDEIREEDIELGFQEEEEEEEEERMGAMAFELYREMVIKGKSFWEVVHRPFLQRELARRDVKNVLYLGLRETRGSYKKLISLFNIGLGEGDYKRFMEVLRVHRLK